MLIEISMQIDGVSQAEAFNNFFQDLPVFLSKRGITFPSGRNEGIIEHGAEIGKVVEYSAPDYAEIRWNTSATWDGSNNSKFRISFEPGTKLNSTRIVVSSHDWGSVLGDNGQSVLEWFNDQVVSSFMSSIAPARFSTWYADSRARSPSGKTAREMYSNPVYHWPNFRKILQDLKLRKEDVLLEVGCGGGAFMQEALKSGCRAYAIDHSEDMVRVAMEKNAVSISAGRLEIILGDAAALPFEDDSFTAVVCTGAFNFLEEPGKFMSEVKRVLKKGGRLIIFAGSKELKGTPASPEPIASLLHFYEDDELSGLASHAGLSNISVKRPSLKEFAEKSGLPDDVVEFFNTPGGGGQFLYAEKC